ncbi:MAG: tRNA epoxyqueuosine(34) reductase QueG [Gammaproteobacteria bacterium]|nr:tRNA epoxyqueuosine(34) reductase QueG [Gammaproteobacteria bacterium]
MSTSTAVDLIALRAELEHEAQALGCTGFGIAGIDLDADERRLVDWLAAGHHGGMHYMARHGTRRSRPAELLPGTLRVVCVRLDYWPAAARAAAAVLADPAAAYVSRYALGRDYHKVLRGALKRLAATLQRHAGAQARVFVDSAPVLEKALARAAGLGWIGKHTNLIARDAGSYFFLGEIYTDVPLPLDAPVSAHCGSCTACLSACPTGAILAPWRLDARRCISYLTIELAGPIPEPLRALIGNRIYGCDDCQLVCPWNRYARAAAHPDFAVRHGLDGARLAELFAWSAAEFERRLAGSAIHRIGHERWLRNLAVGLGNAPALPAVRAALESRRDDPSALVREHVHWALARHSP